MKTFRTALALLMAGAILALVPAVAAAKKPAPAKSKPPASTNQIVLTCTHDHNQLPGHYSIAALKAAYNSIPVATLSYTTCAQVIQNKLQAESSGGHLNTGKGSGGGFPVIIVIIVVIVVLGGAGAFYSYRRSRSYGSDAAPEDGGRGPSEE